MINCLPFLFLLSVHLNSSQLFLIGQAQLFMTSISYQVIFEIKSFSHHRNMKEVCPLYDLHYFFYKNHQHFTKLAGLKLLFFWLKCFQILLTLTVLLSFIFFCQLCRFLDILTPSPSDTPVCCHIAYLMFISC